VVLPFHLVSTSRTGGVFVACVAVVCCWLLSSVHIKVRSARAPQPFSGHEVMQHTRTPQLLQAWANRTKGRAAGQCQEPRLKTVRSIIVLRNCIGTYSHSIYDAVMLMIPGLEGCGSLWLKNEDCVAYFYTSISSMYLSSPHQTPPHARLLRPHTQYMSQKIIQMVYIYNNNTLVPSSLR